MRLSIFAIPLLILSACNNQPEKAEQQVEAPLVLPPCCLESNTTVTAPREEPWYKREERPATLKEALALGRDYRDRHNPSRPNGSADPRTCAALRSVEIACDYSTRYDLSQFLAVNGKGLFPAAGRTNPYVNSIIDEHGPEAYYEDSAGPDDVFIGQPRQNAMLAAAVRRNAALFRDGDLSARDVQQRWR